MSPRALQEFPGSSQELSEIAPRVPKSVPRAQTVAKAPWNSGYARKLRLFVTFRRRFLPACNISSSSAASAELHSLRYLSHAMFATTRWLRDATVATPRWLRYVRYATFAMLCALRYVRYAALASLCWLHYVHHAAFATLRLLRYTLAALHSPRCVRYATFATLHWPRCVRYAAFATLRLLRYAGQTAFATLLSLRYICYATHSLRCVRHAAFATLCWIWKCAAIVQNDIVNKRSCEATGRRARHKQGQQSFVHGMHRSTLVYIYIYIYNPP